MTLTEAVKLLAENQIAFQCVFSSPGTDQFWTIEITDSLNAEQLKAITSLPHASMGKNGIIRSIGRGYE